ncbi:MAG: radical SAM protein [Oscillospiraceae bacterium]|nr:radical SAM protein [Oscillospiraceae bacterium]
MPFMPFQTRPGFYYVYDMNKNSVYKTDKQRYDSLCDIKNESNEDTRVLSEFQEKGLLLDSSIERIEHPASQLLEYQMKRCISTVTFQMSQNCNLRCSYCPYSDNGIYDNRARSDKNIKWDTVQKGIDFLIANSVDSDNLHVSFYGGEPLIVKELVVRAMRYTVEQISGKNITFGMTTNATLLDHKFAEAVKDFNISIMVSLDGPKEIHDKNRSYADGRGSFDTLRENIMNIKEHFPELYKKITYNTVIYPGTSYHSIFEFFRNNQDIFDYSKVSFNELSQNYTDMKISYDESYYSERNYELLKAYLLLLGKINNKAAPELKGEIERIYSYKQIFTPQKSTGPIAHPSGTCVPGLKKLFIDVNGNFYPCERIDENSALMNIGSLEKGFDIEKVREVLNVGTVSEEACRNCWAFHCCNMCPISSDNGKDKHYSKSYKLSKCNNVKAIALEKLKDYTMLREFKFDFNEESIML